MLMIGWSKNFKDKVLGKNLICPYEPLEKEFWKTLYLRNAYSCRLVCWLGWHWFFLKAGLFYSPDNQWQRLNMRNSIWIRYEKYRYTHISFISSIFLSYFYRYWPLLIYVRMNNYILCSVVITIHMPLPTFLRPFLFICESVSIPGIFPPLLLPTRVSWHVMGDTRSMVPQFRIIMLLLDLLVDTKRLFRFAIFFCNTCKWPNLLWGGGWCSWGGGQDWWSITRTSNK